ncbi:Rieske (2Fe-2S) protein [Streptomyces sp. NPDC059785]|uniref:Rieske (2Fe-2S) protein n=1 Tax=unclassified Streptomyces TaxID=2593676 RepID=UPI00366347EE
MTSASSEAIESRPSAVPGPARRAVVAAAGAAGLAVALAACGSDDKASDSTGTPPDVAGSSSQDGDGGSGGGDNVAGGGTALAKTADIPEGGGAVFADQGVVVTQPTAGTFKAFSSKCTHAGCAVKGISDGVINCPCHGSQFSAEDGSVKKGPATKPLAERKISVDGDSIVLA